MSTDSARRRSTERGNIRVVPGALRRIGTDTGAKLRSRVYPRLVQALSTQSHQTGKYIRSWLNRTLGVCDFHVGLNIFGLYLVHDGSKKNNVTQMADEIGIDLPP